MADVSLSYSRPDMQHCRMFFSHKGHKSRLGLLSQEGPSYGQSDATFVTFAAQFGR